MAQNKYRRFSAFLNAAGRPILVYEEDAKEQAHLKKLEACKEAVHAVLSKHKCKLQGTRFGVLVAALSGAQRRIKL